jgi:hypothetical protein
MDWLNVDWLPIAFYAVMVVTIASIIWAAWVVYRNRD